MEQSELNKKLYEAISSSTEESCVPKRYEYGSPFFDKTDKNSGATACEIICLQEKIDLLNEVHNYLGNDSYYIHKYLADRKNSLTEQLNSLKSIMIKDKR